MSAGCPAFIMTSKGRKKSKKHRVSFRCERHQVCGIITKSRQRTFVVRIQHCPLCTKPLYKDMYLDFN